MTTEMVRLIEIKEDIIEDDKYKYAFSVEEVNRRAKEGTPFRDAYKQVGIEIEEGRFTPDKNINHTHEGSIGNLCNDQISKLEEEIIAGFGFEKFEKAQNELLNK